MGLKKRHDTCKPLNITPYLHMRSGKNNTIAMKCAPKHAMYIVSFQLVKIHKVVDLMKDIIDHRTLPKGVIINECKHKTKPLFNILDQQKHSESNEIMSTLDTISLVDPISLCRINTPSRSKNCKHTQCFDLETYLEMNLDIPQWRCGICNTHAPYEDIIVDQFFESILQTVGKESEVEQVDIFNDASWKVREVVVETGQDSVRNEERKRKRESVMLKEPKIEEVVGNNGVIDLTLDSDSDMQLDD